MAATPLISSRPFRILSIDGGGLRGILVAKILQWIEENVLGQDTAGKQRSIVDSFDLFAGTSTGGLIACALTVSDTTGLPIYSLKDICDIYEHSGSTIFPFSSNKFQKSYKWLQNKFGPKYSRDGLTKVLQGKLAGKRILDCSKNILVPTYDVGRFRPVQFTSRVAKQQSLTFNANADKYNCTLLDVCYATSAAPTYFPSHVFEYTDSDGRNDTLNCIDGGIHLNNPALAAYAEVLKHWDYYRIGQKIVPEDIHILSIGTGIVPKHITKKSGERWGEIRWAKNVIAAAMLGNSQNVEDQLRIMMGPHRYYRINLDIDPIFAEMDDSSPATTKHLIDDVFTGKFVNNGVFFNQLLSFKNIANL